MIPPLARLLFVLVPLGGVLLAVGIRTVRRSFFGPLVAELAMDGGATTFTVHSPSVFGLWCKWPMFQRSPLDAVHPVVIDDATGIAVPLRHAFFRPHGNDGVTAWFEFRRFSAAAGSYRLELQPGSGIPTAFERIVHRVVPLPQAEPSRCAVQVRESQSAVWLAAGISLLVLAGMLLIGGLVGGILVATIGRARAAQAAPPQAGPLDERTVSELLSVDRAAELARSDAPLQLDGLESIATDVAAALEPHRSLLSLDRIRQVDAATAAALARHAGPLKMGSLERIDSDVLFTKLLGDVPRDDAFHWFMQDELRSLTDAQAAAIARHRFSLVMIPKAALTERQGGILADAAGEICVGADVIPNAALRRLADRPGDLAVVARKLSDEQAVILAARRGPLTLHVVDLAESAAKILATPAGPLKLTTGPDPALP